MHENPTFSEAIFMGPLSDVLTEFVKHKRLLGCKYNTELVYLRQMALLASDMRCAPNCLTQDLVERWTGLRQGEAAKTWQNRIAVVKELALFMQSLRYEAFMTPTVTKHRPSSFIPHIFTSEELHTIFENADQVVSYTNCPNRTAVASLLFRMLYCCGLRLSEALTLQLKYVDIQNGTLTIYGAKNDVSRIVPMSPELTRRCASYIDEIHIFSEPDDYLYPAPQGGRYGKEAIYHTWRQILSRSGIPYKGRKYGPRIHDLRHTFVVDCLKMWFHKGEDINAALPILSVYLGHSGIKATQIYLHLTADLFPDIKDILEQKYGCIIAPIQEACYETE